MDVRKTRIRAHLQKRVKTREDEEEEEVEVEVVEVEEEEREEGERRNFRKRSGAQCKYSIASSAA